MQGRRFAPTTPSPWLMDTSSSTEGTRAKDAASGALTGAELNYGLIPNGQLTIGGEAAFNGAGARVPHATAPATQT